MISIRYWKLAAVILCATLAAAGILLGGWAASTYGEQLGPGFVFLFRLDAARLVRGFAAIGLLLAGELALLISWARAQSLQDFNGRYRGWVFCALLGFLAAFGLQTQLAAAWSATATWLWATPFSHKATLLLARSDGDRAACSCTLISFAKCEIAALSSDCSRGWRPCSVAARRSIVLARPLPLPVAASPIARMRRGAAVCRLRLFEFARARSPRRICVRRSAVERPVAAGGSAAIRSAWGDFQTQSIERQEERSVHRS